MAESTTTVTDQAESKPDLSPINQEPAQQKLGVGAAFMREREKKGLSLDQVASVTNLRAQVIEALENESWAQLPHPVFVRGFIRSYAKLLELNEEEFVRQYENFMPVKTEAPIPLVAPRRARKGWLLFLVLLLLLMGSLFSVWIAYSSFSWNSLVGHKENVLKTPMEEEKPSVKPEPAKEEGSEGKAPSEGSVETEAPLRESDPDESRFRSLYAELKNNEGKTSLSFSGVQEDSHPSTAEDVKTLKVAVVDTTWMRVTIDRGEPKEYLLSPGMTINWKAKEGYVLVVGNAAGIELELNGKKLGKLGNMGQVVRVSLPKGFGRTRSED